MLAQATAKALGLSGLGTLNAIKSEAIVAGTVEAFIGAQAASDVSTSPTINVGTGQVKVDADSYMKALATADGLGASAGLRVNVMLPTAKVTGTTRAYMREGTDVDAGSLTIAAGTTADRVKYEAGSDLQGVGDCCVWGRGWSERGCSVDRHGGGVHWGAGGFECEHIADDRRG